MATNPGEVLQRAFRQSVSQDRPAGVTDPTAQVREALKDFEVASPVPGAETDWKRRRISEALESLTPLERAAVVLARCHGMSCQDIATRTGHSKDQVRAALASGLAVCVTSLNN
jgi:RNA polymerase sigma factor (sigma-70 family)